MAKIIGNDTNGFTELQAVLKLTSMCFGLFVANGQEDRTFSFVGLDEILRLAY